MKYSKKDDWHRGNYKQHTNAVEAKLFTTHLWKTHPKYTDHNDYPLECVLKSDKGQYYNK